MCSYVCHTPEDLLPSTYPLDFQTQADTQGYLSDTEAVMEEETQILYTSKSSNTTLKKLLQVNILEKDEY